MCVLEYLSEVRNFVERILKFEVSEVYTVCLRDWPTYQLRMKSCEKLMRITKPLKFSRFSIFPDPQIFELLKSISQHFQD